MFYTKEKQLFSAGMKWLKSKLKLPPEGPGFCSIAIEFAKAAPAPGLSKVDKIFAASGLISATPGPVPLRAGAAPIRPPPTILPVRFGLLHVLAPVCHGLTYTLEKL